MNLIVLMRYRIPSAHHNFKGIIEDQALRTSFYDGFLISIKHLRLISGGDPLTLFDMGFFEPSVIWGGGGGWGHEGLSS